MSRGDSYGRIVIVLGWLAYFSFGVVLSAIAPMVTPISSELHLNYGQMGVVLGSWQLVYVFSSFLVGLASDRIGNRFVIGVGLGVVALSALLRAVAVDYFTLLVGVAVFGTGGSAISVGLPKLAAEWFSSSQRNTATGVYLMGNYAGIAFGLASVNSVFVPWLGGWRAVYVFFAAMTAVVTGLWWLLSRNPPDHVISTPPLSGRTIGFPFGFRNAWLIAFVGISYFLMTHGIRNWLPTIAQLTGLSAVEAGFYASIPSVVSIGAALIFPYIIPGLRRKAMVTILLVIGAVSTGLIGVSSGLPFLTALLIQGVSQGSITPLLMLILMNSPEIGAARMGAVTGLYYTIGEVGGFIGPSILGYSKDATGSFIWGILVIVVSLIVSAIVLQLLVRETPINASATINQ